MLVENSDKKMFYIENINVLRGFQSIPAICQDHNAANFLASSSAISQVRNVRVFDPIGNVNAIQIVKINSLNTFWQPDVTLYLLRVFSASSLYFDSSQISA